jgi:hypothetical protein
MNNQEVWVKKLFSTPLGEIEISMRLDTVLDPEFMCDKLDKESEVLWKKMDKVLDKLAKINDKTPQKIIDLINVEMTNIHNQQKHNMEEYWRWSDAWDFKILAESNGYSIADLAGKTVKIV